MGEWERCSCERADELRARSDLSPVESLTNFIGGEVSDHSLPPYTRTMWGTDDGNVLIDRLDESGCYHWEKHAEGSENDG